MAYKLKQLKNKERRKQSYIWKITYEDLNGHQYIYSQQSVTKEKAIRMFELDHPTEKLISIKLNEDYPTVEEKRKFERDYIRGLKGLGM